MSIQYCEQCNRTIDTEKEEHEHFDETPKVETIDWSKKVKNPAGKEHLRQKQESTKHECRHLKPLEEETETIYDDKMDESIEITHKVCPRCSKALTKKELEARKLLLMKFGEHPDEYDK